ncbi:hypothetical protein KR222_008078, partial [Zaprionus bogoriensis]
LYANMTVLILLLCLTSTVASYNKLYSTIVELSQGLESQTNVIYTDDRQSLGTYTQLSQAVRHTPSILISKDPTKLINISTDKHENLLMILPKLELEIIQQVFETFPVKMQKADYLFVGVDKTVYWFQLLSTLWDLGFPNVLIYNFSGNGDFYTSDPFPKLQLIPSSIEHYLWARRHWFDNLRGWEVRTIISNNPPRTLVDAELQIFDGYVLKTLREFLSYKNAKFVPVLVPDYKIFSPKNCMKYLQEKKGELCGDVLAYNTDFSFTDSYMYLYANILIPTPKARSKNYYIIEPFDLKIWLLIALYMFAICSFSSFVCWVQNGRWDFIKIFLEILCSLVCAGFRLRGIVGRLHYILFSTIFVGGFIFSNYYLAFLRTLLSTGLYELPIKSFEELVRRNISIIVPEYDKVVLEAYDYPSILWNITRVMPYVFILEHRRVFNTSYAYMAYSDRFALFEFQQQYMKRPKMRTLPIDIVHSLPGYPMRREWLLKFKLSEALLNCFGTGLIQKIMDDTNMQTIRMGYLDIIPSEEYKAEPLTLDNFRVPLLMLVVGNGIAFFCLLAERL